MYDLLIIRSPLYEDLHKQVLKTITQNMRLLWVNEIVNLIPKNEYHGTLNNTFKFLWLTLILIPLPINSTSLCHTNDPPSTPKYHLIEKCHRSSLGIAAKANFTSLTSCQRLGFEKKALALNFSPPEAESEGGEPLDYTCEVLKCAEADGGLSLMNDTRYDYYSIYARPIPDVNSTCVPATGMFQLLEKRLNFSQAEAECRNRSGVLADVASEQRTDALAQLLVGSEADAALVGMRRRNNSGFHGPNGDSLECITYRAWAPGHPKRYRNKFDCVVLTRRRAWQSVSCKKEHAVLCELIPGGPYKRGSIFASRTSQEKNDTITETDGRNNTK